MLSCKVQLLINNVHIICTFGRVWRCWISPIVAFFVEMNLQLGIIVSNDVELRKPNATDQGELLHVRPSRE